MVARHQIYQLLKQWLHLTRRESHVLQIGRWSELPKIQKAKDLLQGPLTGAFQQWQCEELDRHLLNVLRHGVEQLRGLELRESQLLAVRKREVREKILLLEQALEELSRLSPSQVGQAA
jgi:hypothetical protein